MTVPVAGDTARAIAILGIRLWAAVVARANERRLELIYFRISISEISGHQSIPVV